MRKITKFYDWSPQDQVMLETIWQLYTKSIRRESSAIYRSVSSEANKGFYQLWLHLQGKHAWDLQCWIWGQSSNPSTSGHVCSVYCISQPWPTTQNFGRVESEKARSLIPLPRVHENTFGVRVTNNWSDNDVGHGGVSVSSVSCNTRRSEVRAP